MIARNSGSVSYAEYLALEDSSSTKNEFLGGTVVAMAGGTPTHAGLQAAVVTLLSVALRGRPCRVYSSDLRIRSVATDFAGYPDVTVVCGRLETSSDDSNAATNPKLVVEVLSDTTEAYDRGTKAAHYRRIASLAEYVFVSQHDASIEVYRRNERDRWELAVEAKNGELVELASVGVSISVDEVYADPLVGAGEV